MNQKYIKKELIKYQYKLKGENMDRNRLKDLAKETLDIVGAGQYKVNGKTVKLNYIEIGDFYGNDYLEKLDVSRQSKFVNTEIEIVNESTVDTIFRLKEDNIGVLNFASAHNPGGGFQNGAMAQEECLAYCSNLYDTLEGNEFYEINNKVKSKMYTDNMIIGDVGFFRTGSFKLVEKPKTVTVVTSAAVNMEQVLKHQENEEEAKRAMKNRMRKILKLMTSEGCKTVVLGAFGCGVFGNNTKDVANNWLELLIEEDMLHLFKKVVFAVYDRPGKKGNYEIFKEILEIK